MYGIGVTDLNNPLEILDLPAPRQPQEGELLLDVIAGGIGAWDLLLPNGVWDVSFQPPAAIGVEGVGRIAAVGPNETDFAVDDVVLVHEAPLPNGSGTWAEQVLVQAAHVARLPEGLSTQVAAALPIGGLTAVQSLDELQVGNGTRLLVIGASGPTAALAVQLAHLRGADVVAGAGPKHAEQLRAYGASEVIDTHVEDWAQKTDRRFDAVLIGATGTAEKAITLLEDGGRLVSITSDAPESVRGITSVDLYVEPDGKALSELATLAAAGKLVVDVQATPARDGIPIVHQVAEGRSGGVKHVLEF
jgi:NADPH:quinone reductase-like Zn-dependent oxidoreductase